MTGENKRELQATESCHIYGILHERSLSYYRKI